MLPSRRPDERELQRNRRPGLLGSLGADFELIEEEDAFVLAIEMPGYDLDDISVNWDEGRLFVSAGRDDADRGRRKSFRRSFRVPKEVDADGIEAQYRNGVLEIRLPIMDPRVRGTEIEVKPG